MNTELSNDEPVADGYRLIVRLCHKDYYVSWIKVLYKAKKKRASFSSLTTVLSNKTSL